jgi:RimJ/RimL family protein N-acetyltransferase
MPAAPAESPRHTPSTMVQYWLPNNWLNMTSGNLGPCTLAGSFVRLEPLREEHSAPLFEAAQRLDWKWFLNPLRTKEDVESRIAESAKAEQANDAYVFAVRLASSNAVVGSTSYFNIVAKHKRAEIGSTWYVPSVWGTAVNPECKYLLLNHAFEDWGAIRIQLTTDVNNVHSQRAIMKLGAKFEGTLRNNGIRPDGSYRDSMLYSIVASEWPSVKARLLSRIHSF